MTKINLNTSPYFDDFDENKKFYKILFRPGRSVQARELTQLQTILQNQVARLGGFKQGDLVHPSGPIGARFSNTTVFVKALKSQNPQSSLINNEEQLNMHWVGKFVTNQDGVKGKVVGFDIHGDVVRLLIELSEASKKTGKKTFSRGDKISVVALDNSTISFNVETAPYSTGRLAKVSIPQSIYFYNGYFVLVDEQTLFLTPDNKNNDADWNTTVTTDVGIKMTESIVRHDQDPSLLENATGTPNYGGAGADRLKVEGVLVKRQRQTIEQNFIKIMSLEKGVVVDAPLVNKEELGIKSETEARRVFEESGNYIVSPFLANPVSFLSTDTQNGLYSETTELSFGYTDEDEINEDQAKAAALELAKNLFKMQVPSAIQYQSRYYPGTSYDDVDDPTSFKNMCNEMMGIRIEPGTAYVQGYRASTAEISKVAVKKARTSDYQPAKKIQTPIGQYMLITNVFGCPEIGNDGWPYDDIELHSTILDLNVSNPEIPISTTKIGTARVCHIGLQSGASGSTNAVYQLGFFDLKLNPGHTFNDVKSIYSNGKSTTGKDFLANLVLKNSIDNPWIVFSGTVEKLANPYSLDAKKSGDSPTQDNPTIFINQGSVSFNLDFAELQNRDACYNNLTLGTAIKFNSSNLVRVITGVKKVDQADDLVPQKQTDTLTGTGPTNVGPFTLTHSVVINNNIKVLLGGTGDPIKPVVVKEGYSNLNWTINGIQTVFELEYAPIETRTTRVVVSVDDEQLSPSLINGKNRTFPIQNPPIRNVVSVYSVNAQGIKTPIEPTFYQVSNGKLTFITLDDGQDKTPKTGDIIRIKYDTYINSTDDKKIILSQPPIANSKIAVTYSYNAYVIDNKSITFADAPSANTTVEYDYLSARRVQITVDSALPYNNFSEKIQKIQVVKKVIGKGTTWKSNPNQSVEAGDWVQIGTDSNKKLYQVFSTPVNDNELNLDPDPTETEDNGGTKTYVNAPWANGAKMTYLTPEDVRSSSSNSNCGLLFKLPHKHIRTVRGGTKNAPNTNTEMVYTVRRYATVDAGIGGVTTVSVNAGENVLPFSSNLYSLVDLETGYWFQLFDANTPDSDAIGTMEPGKPETFKAKVIVNSETSDLQNIVFKTSPSASSNRKFSLSFPVTKTLKEGTKVLVTGGFNDSGRYTNGRTPTGTPSDGFVVTPSAENAEVAKGLVTEISLGKPDIVRVTRIIAVEDGGAYTTAPTDKAFGGSTYVDANGKVHRDITGAYIVDTGQTDYYYGIGKVKLRPGMPIPQGRVRVEFDYYEHPTDNFDYFSVDSYIASGVSYNDIPAYVSSNNKMFDLRSCIDFRPVVRQDTPQKYGLNVFQAYKETPITNLVCSYHVYEARKDLLYVSKTGELAIKQGDPAIDPQYPSDPIDGMTIYKVHIEPYTIDTTDVVMSMVNSKRYTMKDIGLLEKRIKNLEDYTSLSLLEKSTKDLVIKDALGQDKFKHGFLTDTFENPISADILNQEFSAALDTTNNELKPPIQISHIPLMEAALLLKSKNSIADTIRQQEDERKQRNYARADKNTPKKKTSLYTLKYDNVTFIEQPICSRVININPYAVQSFVGSLKIKPWTDTWREIKNAGERVITDSAAYDLISKDFNSNKQRIDWNGAVREVANVRENTEKNGKIKVTGATRSWPVDTFKGGKYLVMTMGGKDNLDHAWVPMEPLRPQVIKSQRAKRDEQGNIIRDAKGKPVMEDVFTSKPGTQVVKIPDGYPGAGQIVPFYEHSGRDIDADGNAVGRVVPGLYQDGYTKTVTTEVQEIGTLETLVDKGWITHTTVKDRIVDISASKWVRSKEIAFEGKGFFPNTRLYAFFDNVDVTKFCIPDDGFGSIEQDPSKKVFQASNVKLKFGENYISTATPETANVMLANLDFASIKNDPAQSFALITGKVNTQGKTLKGSYSELTTPASSNSLYAGYDSYTDFTIQIGDTITGQSSFAQGIVRGISSDKKTLYFDLLSEVAFNATGESIWVKNDETIVSLNENLTKTNNYTFVTKNVPILTSSEGSFQELEVYLVVTDTVTNQRETVHFMDKSTYTITPNTQVIKFNNNKSPQEILGKDRLVHKSFAVEATYTYAGSNYHIKNEEAQLSSSNSAGERKKFTTRHTIIEGTLSVEFYGGTVNPTPTFEISGKTITFSSSLPDTVSVRVNYSTTNQNIVGRQVKSGTKFLTELIAKTDTASGSVITFSLTTEEREITKIIDNATAEMESALSNDITTADGVECADKLEAIQKKFLSTFVDISKATSIERNILNKEIKKISYKPSEASEKLTFHFDSSLMMEEIDSEMVDIYVKKTATQAGSNTTVVLTCDKSGTIRGRFCIPDPNKVGDPYRFTTGDKTFRLTNSVKNESIPTVSRAEAGYTARGWTETRVDEVLKVRDFDILKDRFPGEKTSFSQTFEFWGEVCSSDPVAQSFQVKEKTGVFLTAIDVFFYSKDPFLPVRLQIRPLADGGQPSSQLLYEMALDADKVVVNKVNVKEGTVTVYGATAKDAIPGFNKGPWNTPENQDNGVYTVNSYAYEHGMSYTIIDGNDEPTAPGQRNKAAIEYGFGNINELKNAQSHMIPTRFVFEYPLYLSGNNKNYCFVLLSDSVPGDQAGGDLNVLESTYQVYFAQQGKVYDHDTLATPVHRQTTLMAGEEDLNFVLGTSDIITRIPQADGQLFKSQNGISWVGDPIADLKFKIHKAKFDTTKSADIIFVNDGLDYAQLELSPIETRAGSSKIRVNHDNHNFCPNSYVSFVGIQGDLNGLMPQQIIEPKIHRIESVTLDSYIIDLGPNNIARFDGNVGGANLKASTNIRFEEFTLLANPLVVDGTSLTWRMSGVAGAGPDDTEGQKSDKLYSNIDDIKLLSNVETPLSNSMVVCSTFNEEHFLPTNENAMPWDTKSLKVIATLSSQDENISPIIDTDRLSGIAKTVRLNNPYGVGYLNNINNDVFDSVKVLPSTFVPGNQLPGKIWFSDTDNKLTGSAFYINYRTVTGVGSLFTVELSVGDTIKSPINGETRKVVEISSDTELTIDSPFVVISGSLDLETDAAPNSFTVNSLSHNPDKLRFKTSDANIATALRRIGVGKYLSLSGTENGDRDFYEKLVTNVIYTPANTAIDPELGKPKLCEITVQHVVRDDVGGGYEFGSSHQDMVFTLKDKYVDDIATGGTSTSVKYISKQLSLANAANTMKILFDGCRPDGSSIDLYYITENNNTWTKLEYSIEDNGNLRAAVPPTSPNHFTFAAYEANAIQIKPFKTAQVKIVLRGGDCVAYPIVKNLRVIALEE